MFAENDEEHDQLAEECNGPRDGVGEKQTIWGVELGNLKNSADPTDSNAAHAQDRDNHGGDRSAHTAQRACGHIHKTAEKIGDTDVAQPYHAIGDSLRRVGDVDGKQVGAKGVYQ